MNDPRKVPHLSGPSGEKRQVTDVDTTPWTRAATGPDGVRRIFNLHREPHPLGSYDTHSVCQRCGEHRKAGGPNGERTIALYQTQRHKCGGIIDVVPVFEVDEDTNLFRN